MTRENRAVMVEELVRLDRVIRDLRRVRANATYELEWALKEQDRIRRHLAESGREEMHGRCGN